MGTTDTRRQAILEAMVRAVGRNGYRPTSVADVIAEAGVSRATFHKHFADKQECFLAAYDMLAERLLAEVTERCDAGLPWVDRVQAGLATLVEALALDPDLARMAIVEVSVAGGDARRRHWAAIGRFTELLGDGEGPAADRELPRHIALMAAGAVFGLISDELRTGPAERLPRMLPELIFALLVPYVGPGAAAEEMRKAAAG